MASYLDRLFNLSGKVAMLTGAGGHLVGEMARSMARAGMRVVLLDVNEPAVRRVARTIQRRRGGQAVPLPLDVTERRAWERALHATLERFGRVDVLVNGAGINAPTRFFDITEEEWHRIIDVHVTGTMLGSQTVGRRMVKQRAGSIINISSASSGPPLSKAFAYSVAKAGVKNLTQNLAREWAPSGVRVNALRPGFFPTEWSKVHFLDKRRVRAILAHTPMGRFGAPHELVSAVLWLSSPAAGFVTGAEIPVDGGFTAMTI